MAVGELDIPAVINNDNTAGSKTVSPEDQKLLKRIRDRFTYMTKRWEKIRESGDKDMQALGPEGPWDPSDRAARNKAKRPTVHLDQLNQYPRTLVNQVRQNPQGVKVVPAGNGANDETATLRGDRIRAIEKECNASQAYLTALQCAAERGYGVVTLETEEIAWDSFDQRIKIVREPDPNAVIWDPDSKEADSSDMQDGFKLWNMPIDDFKRKFPGAAIVDFNTNDQLLAPDWINLRTQMVQVGRYSFIEKTIRHLYLLNDGSPLGRKVFKDQLPKGVKEKDGFIELDGKRMEVLREKKAVEQSVRQCTTNGLEILDKTDWSGKWVPIFPMLGAEKYIRKDGVTERILESYIRPAIDGQKGFDSASSNQVESANMVPKATYLGYKGQFNTSTDWEHINQINTPYAEVDPMPDAGGGQPLPLPQRTDFNPQIEAMEVLKESNRRAIQAAIGSKGFTISDDTNVKSGKAVNLLKAQSDVGSFHFIDNYETTLRHIGRAVDDLLDKIEDTPRDVARLKSNGKREVIRINEPFKDESGELTENRYTPRDPETNEPMTGASHGVEIDTGGFGENAKERAREFTQSLMASPMGPLVADILVKIEDLGPYTEELEERLTPPQFRKQDGEQPIPPEVQQQLQEKDLQLQALNEHSKQIEQQLIELQDKAKAEQVKAESAERIAQQKIQTDAALKEKELELKRIELQQEAQVNTATLDQERELAELKARTEIEIAELKIQADLQKSEQERAQEAVAMKMTQDHETQNKQADREHGLQLAEKTAVMKKKAQEPVAPVEPKKRHFIFKRDAAGNATEVVEE